MSLSILPKCLSPAATSHSRPQPPALPLIETCIVSCLSRPGFRGGRSFTWLPGKVSDPVLSRAMCFPWKCKDVGPKRRGLVFSYPGYNAELRRKVVAWHEEHVGGHEHDLQDCHHHAEQAFERHAVAWGKCTHRELPALVDLINGEDPVAFVTLEEEYGRAHALSLMRWLVGPATPVSFSEYRPSTVPIEVFTIVTEPFVLLIGRFYSG